MDIQLKLELFWQAISDLANQLVAQLAIVIETIRISF